VLRAGLVVLALCAALPAVAQDRASLIARANVWAPSDIPSKDLRLGVAGDGGFTPGQTVRCDYVKLDLDGNSPKFKCRLALSDEVKVKYGNDNGEVYGEVVATRLLWALGFGADRMYPVRVLCRGCPETIGVPSGQDDERLVEPAAIERRIAGRELPDDLAGWSWVDLERIDEAAGGAPRAQRDALKLLAVVLQHSDTKPEQQRLICLDDECLKPVMMLNDVGLTFGRASFTNDNALSSVNLAAWSATPVWKGDRGCVGNLPRSFTGTLRDPLISEAGRTFLLGLLDQLSDAQLRDLFGAAHVERRRADSRANSQLEPTVEDWVRAFRAKQAEIALRRCPEDWSSQAPPLLGTGSILWLQSWSSAPLTIGLNAVSLLGYTRVYLFIALVIAVAVRFQTGAALLLTLAMTAVLTDAAKSAASLPRPDAVDASVRRLSLTSHPELLPAAVARFVPGLDGERRAPSADDEDSYGFPSGHVAAATAFLLGLRILAGWRPAGLLLALWVPLMALSRIYLGRHFPVDVVGGAAIGVVAVAGAWRLRLHLLDHPVRGINIALRMGAVATAVAICALTLRMPAPSDAGHLLGIAAATLLVILIGPPAHLTAGAGARRALLASALLAAAWWTVPATIDALGQSSLTGAGAVAAGALPLFIAVAGGSVSRGGRSGSPSSTPVGPKGR
jgi:membrane-associated phospholipid phosphatase